LRTSLVFKFFIIILLFTCVYGNICAFGRNAIAFHTIALKDTIDVYDTVFQAPSRRVSPVAVDSDTLIFESDDVTVQEAPRQRGTGVILDATVDYSAKDSIRFDIRNQVVHLYGDAELEYQNIHLTAAYINIDFKQNELVSRGMPDSVGVIVGNPIFTEGDQSFESRELRYNFKSRRGRTINVMTEEADGYMHGDVVKIMDDKTIHVHRGKYTTCDDPHPHFYISFRKAKIIPNDKIISNLAFLTIEGVWTPLFLPFGFFPNKKGQASGIIIPSYGEERQRGFNLRNGGFYWGINDYMDLSITGDIYSRGSWATNMRSTYRRRYRYSGGFNLSYAINIFSERDLPDFSRSRDFRVVWNHSQDPKARPNSVFRANVNAGSSQHNRFNPTSNQDYLSNTLASNISYSANWAGMYNLSVNARHSQNTITRMVDLGLPEITFGVNRFYPLRRSNPEGNLRWYENITMSYNSVASNQVSIKDSLLFDRQVFSHMKNGVQHSIPISHNFRFLKHLNFSNTINYTERWYFQSVEQRWEEDLINPGIDPVTGRIRGDIERDTIWGFNAVRDFGYSAGVNTKLYGMMLFSRGPVTALRHVVTPTMGFSLRPDFGSPFWGYYQTYDDPNLAVPVQYATFQGSRFGGPSPGRSGALSFSVANNLEMKVRSRKEGVKDTKIALIDQLTFSTSYDIARDSLNLSPLNINGRTRLFGQFDIGYASSWTPYQTDELGRSINRYIWQDSRRFYQMNTTNWNTSFNYNMGSKTKTARNDRAEQALDGSRRRTTELPFGMENGFEQEEDDEPEVVLPPTPKGMIDYTVPWNLRFSYVVGHQTRYDHRNEERIRNFNQSLTFSGDVSLTPNWRIGFNSGYNFDQKTLTYTSLNVYRDLHCWELIVNWVPFGFRQSYNMTLRVKSSMLQDLKLERRTHHLDYIPF
jgi:hypothetical protein